ncbi:MAG TPA: B12-binding domain-containing radical SAM protein [Planctomycetaceae bacterium]|nr:B12-binding domain-containing radical SAM protein [Planctomycetaceae bacterium]
MIGMETPLISKESRSLGTRFSMPNPLGSTARVLLTSVFGPYARDDEYGSRALNPMELYHNQVTRVQGPFSLRMFHRSWGLMLIQVNIAAPCTLLDFPTQERFVDEIRAHPYDVVGISGITTNVLKVKRMCELIREHRPEATIVVGGHVTNIADLEQRIDADWIVRGEGVRWFRRYLGEDPDQPIRHPVTPTRIGTRAMGIQAKEKRHRVAATLIPSVGCPVGCNFCATSAMFGGKGKWFDFYRTGDELFDVMCRIEKSLDNRSFFVMDENFLLHRRRALRLLELMRQHDKSWILYVFSSASVLESYTVEQLVALGISWVWMGIEGEDSDYAKLDGIDTFALVRRLQSHGIRVLGSTIIGLEEHGPDNIDRVIDHAVRHNTDFHQFMLYMPLPGTPLYAEFSARGLLVDEDQVPPADTHGQCRFNYRHPRLPPGTESDFIVRAFQRDFAVNGPSLLRVLHTTLAGWKKYKNHPDVRIRRRFTWEIEGMATTWAAVAGAARRYYRGEPRLRSHMAGLLNEIYREFGWTSRFFAAMGGPYVLWKIRREERRLARGWTYEPPTFHERNDSMLADECPAASRCWHVTPGIALTGHVEEEREAARNPQVVSPRPC